MWKIFQSGQSFQNIDSDQLQKILRDNPTLVLLDVRTASEFKGGAIPGAVNIDVMQFSFKQKVRALETGATYAVICRSGGRSSQACKIMSKMGFENLYNLSGGMSRWSGEVKRQ
ncbi:MAG: rhodanese-like domain-containing protein [Salibacteraceae bacterium]